MPRIAYLGPEGTFTEAALLKISASGLVPGSASSDGITRPFAENSGRVRLPRAATDGP